MNIEDHWKKYFDAKKSGIRKKLHAELAGQIAFIESIPLLGRDDYLDAMIAANIEKKLGLPLAAPRILPHIKKRLEKRLETPDADTLLAVSLLYHLPGMHKLTDGRYPVDLLENALKIDPNHRVVAENLYDQLLYTMDFSLHELPTGLLIEVEAARGILKQAKDLAASFPELKSRTLHYCLTMKNYEDLFELWMHYDGKVSPKRFEEWPKIRRAFDDATTQPDASLCSSRRSAAEGTGDV